MKNLWDIGKNICQKSDNNFNPRFATIGIISFFWDCIQVESRKWWQAFSVGKLVSEKVTVEQIVQGVDQFPLVPVDASLNGQVNKVDKQGEISNIAENELAQVSPQDGNCQKKMLIYVTRFSCFFLFF